MTAKIYFRYRDLVRLRACSDRERFREVFGERVMVTVTTAVANAQWFDWFWIAEMALTPTLNNEMRQRIRAAYGPEYCPCALCDPEGARGRFIAQAFVEAFLKQDGFGVHAGE